LTPGAKIVQRIFNLIIFIPELIVILKNNMIQLSHTQHIDTKFSIWVAYIKRQLGIAAQFSVIKVKVAGIATQVCGIFLLAHMRTMSSMLAFVMAQCLSSIVRVCVRPFINNFTNIFSSTTTHWISHWIKLHRNDPRLVSYQGCSNRYSWLHK